jgi:cell division septum initiation protein DivIVA
MDAILYHLAEMEEVLESSKKSMLFSDKVSVDKNKLMDIITDLRLNLPDDIRMAQRILGDHESVLEDAQRKAANIIELAEEEAQRMVRDDEITHRATKEAQDIIDAAKKDAREMRMSAVEYADGMLEKAESKIRETMTYMDKQNKIINEYFMQTVDVLYENRQHLRNV